MIAIQELEIAIKRKPDGLSLNVYVQPGAKRTALVGLHGDRIKIALRQKAIDGRANAALLELLAETLAVARSAVVLASGARSRQKTVKVAGDTDALVKALAAGLAPDS